ncbi:MAG: YigZ family protein [Bacteroidales bacterium]|nr:YigZ family protein [Bacteroidales bacterium]
MKNEDTYLTIASPCEGLFKDKGSRFLAFAFPVYSEEDARTIIENLRKKYHDARHHCYAYKMGVDRLIYRTNDDGEPSGTAGKPIYGQIQSFGLTNVLIVVVRYFGGKLLGTGGLVNAYKSAAEDALSHARIVKDYLYKSAELKFEYKHLSEINRVLQSFNCEIIEQLYDEHCYLKVKIRRSFATLLAEKFSPFKDIHISLI